MNIQFATYIDHQSEINFPIKYLLPDDRFKLKVFCSDEENKRVLKEEGFDTEVIGIKITHPRDIATAQNACIDKIINDNDFVVWVQGDIHIPKEGIDEAIKWCKPENRTTRIAYPNIHLCLYHVYYEDYYGVNIIGKTWWKNSDGKERFRGDGAYLGDGTKHLLTTQTISIGYLSIKQFRDHVRQHNKTGLQNNSKMLDLPDIEMIKEQLKVMDMFPDVRKRKLIQPNTYYHELIKKMRYEEEYEKVKQSLWE